MKKLLFALAVAICAVSAQASYLYWQVDSSNLGALGITDSGSSYLFNGNTITGVNIKDAETGTALNSYLVPTGDTATGTDLIASGGAIWAIDLNTSGSTANAFYVELIGYDNAVYNNGTGAIGVSETYATSTMKEYIGSSLVSVPAAVWHGGGAIAAPEPTSAMMILLGLAGIALKRKQV